MTAKKMAWTAFVVGAVLILAFYFLQNAQSASTQAGSSTQAPPAAAAEDTAEATADAPATTEAAVDSPAGVDRANGFAQVSPDADQAPPAPSTPPASPDTAEASGKPAPEPSERQEITIPPTPTPDMQDPVAVAGAFLTVYNSRSTESDESWKDTTGPWLVPDLAAQLPLVPNGALEGKTPAAVRTVKVGENVEDWGIDTPLRWAHHVQVTVDTQDQGSYLLEYRLRSQLTDQGWLINAAPLDSWQKVEG